MSVCCVFNLHLPTTTDPTITTKVLGIVPSAAKSSEAVSLKGYIFITVSNFDTLTYGGLLTSKQALTPIIAGTVCGFFLVLAWSAAFVSYLLRRRKKKLRAKKVAAGLKCPKPEVAPPEKYILPPDPAVVLGQAKPGEHIVVDSKHKHGRHIKHSKTMPATHESAEEGGEATGSGSDEKSASPGHLNRMHTEPLQKHSDQDKDNPVSSAHQS